MPNRLVHSTSPYLLQHAHNPVDWFEWGEEALDLAQALDKPILVSIGYSSCHWCHVMERESFEDESIAAVMNESYICIKVDREERPDVDQIYMEAVQALGVHGGWPLNVFLTPRQKPFFGGTYFSPASWTQVLQNVARAYEVNRDQIENTADELALHLMRSDIGRFVQRTDSPSVSIDLSTIAGKLSERFDRRRGGMTNVPKFIMPSVWRFLLRYHYLSSDKEILQQIALTLDRIAAGGIYDQLGGGFARYSVDGEWFAPHFEKMLYDNAQLVSLYSEAFAVTGKPEYAQVVAETLAWLEREMTHPDGGFYSALDADSEGVEGKFYAWTAREMDDALGAASSLVKEYYQVSEAGNWEHGMNILHIIPDEKAFLLRHKLDRSEWKRTLADHKQALLAPRSLRVRPGLDDKILTAWNAMMVCGLLDAYATFKDHRYLNAAASNLRFIEQQLCDGNTLYRSFKNKRSTTPAFLDDYAYYIQALAKSYQATFDESYLKRAVEFTEAAIDQFYDDAEQYFFYTSKDAQKLIARKKEIFDNVIPSSNAIMAQNLHILGTIMGRDDWSHLASVLIGSLQALIQSEPSYTSQWAIAMAELQVGFKEVILAGNVNAMRKELQAHFAPFALYVAASPHSISPLTEGKGATGGRDTIYVCRKRVCQLPVHDVAQAIEQIKT